MNIKVSVVIPAYNSAKTIRRAIESVLAQDMPDVEIIVVDDGSTDETRYLLAEYSGKLTVVRQANQGVSVARTNGVHAARGEFIAFLDSDDEWYPNKLKKQLPVFETYPDIALVSTGAEYIDERGIIQRKISRHLAGDIAEKLLYCNMIITSSVLVRKSCLLNLWPLFRNGYDFAEDWELWLRFSARYHIIIISDILVRYHMQKQSLMRKILPQNVRVTYKSIYKHALQDPILYPVAKRNWYHLQANVNLLVACYYYELGKTWVARRELVKAIAASPLKTKWTSAIPILLLPLWLRNKLRSFVDLPF